MAIALRAKNRLFFGDNLDILRQYVDDESVDLVYLDPPFQSNADYNVLFRQKDGSKSAAQLQAFGDTWEWNAEASRAYFEFVEHAEPRASKALQSLRVIVGDSDMLAYLSMMAPRLVELRRVLKNTGSLYLHCDPTASHYLKLVLDSIFGPQNYRSEITWLRSRNPKGSQHKSKQWGSSTDTILFYAKSSNAVLHLDSAKSISSEEEIARRFPNVDERGRWDDGPILRSDTMGARPTLVYEYKGFTPGPAGWRVCRQKLEEIDRAGNLYWTSANRPRRKLRPHEKETEPIGNCWIDIAPINSQAQERLGYQTQKPEALLDRIILASSEEADTVLDPFCGCGTAIASAERLKRRWIGIDITQPAIVVIKQRLKAMAVSGYETRGEPVSLPDAKTLAEQEPYQFQWWALGLVGARRAAENEKKGADKGIDGLLYFNDGPDTTKGIVISVKAGKLHAQYLRDLSGVVAREQAAIGVLISFDEPTKAMRAEAASAGVYQSRWGAKSYPRLQLLTIAELLNGNGIQYPHGETGTNVTYRKGPAREIRPKAKQERLFK